MNKILFVDGINTSEGGANKQTLKVWKQDLEEKNRLYYWEAIPNSKCKTKPKRLFINIVYTFPGIIFRVFKLKFFEYFLKLSFIIPLIFLYKYLTIKPDYVFFNHHSTFYLMFFIPYKKRILISHDLIASKSKSFNEIKQVVKFTIYFEKKLFSSARKIISLSYKEYRYLRRKIQKPIVSLTRIRDINASNKKMNECEPHFFMIGDWRREENIHGLAELSNKLIIDMPVAIYGLGSSQIDFEKFEGKFVNKGKYESLNEIKSMFLIVPSYRGAGIKSKVIEAMEADRFVLGTPEAFNGLTHKVWSNFGIIFKNGHRLSDYVDDFLELNKSKNEKYKIIFNKTYKRISEIINEN